MKNGGRLSSLGKPSFNIAFSYQKQAIVVKSKMTLAIKKITNYFLCLKPVDECRYHELGVLPLGVYSELSQLTQVIQVIPMES